MQPLVRGALAVGVLAVVSAVASRQVRPPDAPREVIDASGAEEPTRMPCGPRELPEGAACVPIPEVVPSSLATGPGTKADGGDDAADDGEEAAPGAHIPRRPDRPRDVRVLALPIEGEPTLLAVSGAPALGGGTSMSGDVDRPVLRLGSPRGTPVLTASLLGEEAIAEVIAIEKLPARGLVVAALATTREGKREDRWLVLYGSLDGAGPGLARGSTLAPGAVVGFVGDQLVPGESHLRFEVRRLRREVDVQKTPLAQLVGDADSIAVDVRNVLRLR